MDMHSRKQYLQSLQVEYLAAKTRKGKSALLTEAEHRTELNRSYLVRVLAADHRWEPPRNLRKHRAVVYGSDLIAPLVTCWDIFGQPCGDRFAPLLAVEVPRLRQFGELTVTDQQARDLTRMSSSTIDRLLAHEKTVRRVRPPADRTKESLLYQKIPTKLSDEFDRTKPGQIQLDAVEHCGASTNGEYATSISLVDVASYWWEGTTVLGKGQQRTVAAIQARRAAAPVPWSELHPDNGTSFINWHLWGYAEQTGLKLSRSRPYKKNDNCFVEQTNGDNIRQYVGHVRYDTPAEVDGLNELYGALRQYKNFFQSVLRLDTKIRAKGHISWKYQVAKTPYHWLIDSPDVLESTKQALTAEYEQLNPAELRRQIDATLTNLAKMYRAKHTDNRAKTQLHSVTFSREPTALIRLPAYVS